MDLMLRTTQKLQAYAPLLVHENPQDVVQIGYGSGETCGIGLDFGVARYTIVDICPGVFEAGVFFDEINRRSYANPKLRKIIMDGKNFIKMTEEKFDVIMNDSTYPGTTGSSALYTYDHFKACRDRLKPKGVLSCWVPLDLLLDTAVKQAGGAVQVDIDTGGIAGRGASAALVGEEGQYVALDGLCLGL